MRQNSELNEELYQANSFTFFGFGLSVCIAGLVWILDIANIFIVERSLVNVAFACSIVSFILAYLVKRIIGYNKKSASFIMLLLFVTMFTVGRTMLTYHMTLFMVFPIVCSVLYHDKVYLHYTVILTAIGFLVSDVLGYAYGLCDANVLLLTTSTKAHLINALTYILYNESI